MTTSCAELVRSTEWARTPLGPMSEWPTSLTTIVGVMLHSRHPMFLFWGPELIQIYNDAYAPSFGLGKHPAAMGQRGADCWQEVWPIIWPQIDDVMSRAKASWHEDQLVPIFRNGRIEEVYWTYGYSPVFLESGEVGGTLVVCTETTGRVISERRLRLLGELAARTAEATEIAVALRAATEVLGRDPLDIAFAVIYGPDTTSDVGVDPQQRARIDAAVDAVRAARARDATPASVPFAIAGVTESAHLVELAEPRTGQIAGCVVFGTSPQLPFDSAYREFLAQVTEQLVVTCSRITTRGVQERAQAERERLLVELAAANRAKDEFLAMLGHELRNPLSPIVTALHLVRRREGGEPSREHQIIERQVAHLVRLVDDLLDVAKITRGKVELAKEMVELGDVIARAVEIAGFLLEQRGHELVLDVPRTGMRWFGDPVRLAQAVSNLLTNAARYTTGRGAIRIAATREDDTFVIRVRDDGIGIAPDMLPRIFDMFVQATRSSDRAQGGLGIGLTLVKTLVAQHGGTVSAHSEGLGRGSEFVIRLPAPASGAVDPELTKPRASVAATRSRRVLLVDDNEDAAAVLAEALRFAGHEVSVAHDPLAALERMSSFPAELAILDIGLPVMDGYELAAQLRELAPGVRLLALTGYGQEHDVARSREAGFERHFVKPVSLTGLLETLDQG